MRTTIFIILSLLNLTVRGQVTIEELLKNPTQYHGKTVSVEGYYVDEFENRSLWASKKDSKEFNIKSSLWLATFSDTIQYLDKKGIKLPFPTSLNSKLLFTGTVYCMPDTIYDIYNGYGHMNGWPGELRNVTVIQKLN